MAVDGEEPSVGDAGSAGKLPKGVVLGKDGKP